MSVRNIARSFSTHSPEQKAAAETKLAELEKSGRFRRPIVTQIEPAPTFYRAEEYHQQYLRKARTHALRDLARAPP